MSESIWNGETFIYIFLQSVNQVKPQAAVCLKELNFIIILWTAAAKLKWEWTQQQLMPSLW